MQLASFRVPPWPTYLHTYLHIHTGITAYMHTYIHTYLHTYIHACIHTYLRFGFLFKLGNFCMIFSQGCSQDTTQTSWEGQLENWHRTESLPAFIWNTVVDLGDGTKYLGPHNRAVDIRRWDYLFKANVVRTILLSRSRVWLTYLWILGSRWPTICFLLLCFPFSNQTIQFVSHKQVSPQRMHM